MKPRKVGIIAVIGAGLIALALRAAIGSGAVSSQASLELGQLNFTHGPVPNFVDGKGFGQPSSAVIDRSVTPNRLYVVDRGNNRVLGWSSIAALQNGSSADLVIGQPDLGGTLCNIIGSSGQHDDTASSLCFAGTGSAAVDASGNLYVADSRNSRVLEYDQPFTTDTVADRVYGQPDFTSAGNTGVTRTSLFLPSAVALDSTGNLYVADSGNNRVLEYNSPLANNSANLVFGTGGSFFSAGSCATGTGGLCLSSAPGQNVSLIPSGLVVDSSGNLYVADVYNGRVLEYNQAVATQNTTANRVIGTCGSFTGNACTSGDIRQLTRPQGLALDNNGALYVSDLGLRRYDDPLNSDTPNIILGAPDFVSSGCVNNGSGPPTAASLCNPGGLAVDVGGNVYVADVGDIRVVRYNPPITSGMAAGLELGQADFVHNSVNLVDGKGFDIPDGIAIDKSVTPNRLYIADVGNNRVLGYANVNALATGTPADIVIGQPDFLSTACNQSSTESASTLCLNDLNVNVNSMGGIAVDPFGNLYVADTVNDRVLEFNTPFSNDTIADHVFGTCGSFTSNQCVGTSANSLSAPSKVAVDQTGRLFVSDQGDNRVLRYSSPLTSSTADLIIGQGDFVGTICFNGGISASSMCKPTGLALDQSGDLFVADGASRVLEYTAPLSNAQSANKVFGQNGDFTNNACTAGPGGMCGPIGISVDSSENLYVLDSGNCRVLEFIPPFAATPTAASVIGQPDFVSKQCKSVSDPDNQNFLSSRQGGGDIAQDLSDNLYLADSGFNRMMLFPAPTATATPTPTATATPTATPTPTPVPAALKLTPQIIKFPATTIGESSKVKTATLFNPNNKKQSSPVIIMSIAATGNFHVAPAATTCGSTLAAGAKCTIGLTFSPAATGQNTGVLTISDNASNTPQFIGLHGKGKAPKH